MAQVDLEILRVPMFGINGLNVLFKVQLLGQASLISFCIPACVIQGVQLYTISVASARRPWPTKPIHLNDLKRLSALVVEWKNMPMGWVSVDLTT